MKPTVRKRFVDLNHMTQWVCAVDEREEYFMRFEAALACGVGNLPPKEAHRLDYLLCCGGDVLAKIHMEEMFSRMDQILISGQQVNA